MEKHEAYETLRFQIITNAVKPGEILNEKDLMAALEIGRTPLRDILLKLQEEGLLKTIPRLGSMVAPLDISEIRELIEVRRELEGFAARLAAERISADQLKALGGILEKAGTETPEAHLVDNISKYFDTQFHYILYQAAHNRKLADILKQLHTLMLRLWFHVGYPTIDFSSQAETLNALMEALAARDSRRAQLEMEAHIDLYAARLKAMFL